MNIYNFIYCFFYNSGQKKNGGGRFNGVLHVFFVLAMHFLLLSEIIRDTTGFKIFTMPRLGNYGESKTKYILLCIPIVLLIWLYYNKKRSIALLKVYNQLYGDAGKKNTIRILIYIVVPTIILISLAVIRQRM
jgi:hypothetical protein